MLINQTFYSIEQLLQICKTTSKFPDINIFDGKANQLPKPMVDIKKFFKHVILMYM